MGKVVFLIFGYAGDVEAFHEVDTLLTVPIDDVIDRAVIATLEDSDVENVRSDEQFLRYLHDLVFTVLMEDDDIVDIGTVEEELVFLKPRSDETFFPVDIEFLVVLHNGFDVDGAEVTHLGTAGIGFSVFLFKHLEPRDRVIGEMVEVLDAGFDLLLQILHQFVRFLGVELGDTDHSDLEQFLDILGPYFANELRFEGREGIINKGYQFLLVRSVLIPLLLIDTVLDEDFLEGSIEVFLFEFAFLNLEFPFEQGFGILGG